MTPEQQAMLDLCDRMLAIEATLGLRQHLSTAPALPELGHRLHRAEAALARLPTPTFSTRRQPQFRSRRHAA